MIKNVLNLTTNLTTLINTLLYKFLCCKDTLSNFKRMTSNCFKNVILTFEFNYNIFTRNDFTFLCKFDYQDQTQKMKKKRSNENKDGFIQKSIVIISQHFKRKVGSWKENEAAGFVLFLQQLFSYFYPLRGQFPNPAEHYIYLI